MRVPITPSQTDNTMMKAVRAISERVGALEEDLERSDTASYDFERFFVPRLPRVLRTTARTHSCDSLPPLHSATDQVFQWG